MDEEERKALADRLLDEANERAKHDPVINILLTYWEGSRMLDRTLFIHYEWNPDESGIDQSIFEEEEI